MTESTLLNERLVCLSRVHSRGAAHVANQLGMDLANFHSYIQHDKSKSPKAQASTSSRRKTALRLSPKMVERLAELHQLNASGFTAPLLDSWLVKSEVDWRRINSCFEITPLLAIDSTASIGRLGLVEAESVCDLQLYRFSKTAAQEAQDFDKPSAEHKTNPAYLSQFVLAKVVAGNTWRAVLVRMTGLKLESLLNKFWKDPETQRGVYHYQRRQQLFHIQQVIKSFEMRTSGRFSNKDSELSDFIRAQCYPVIRVHIDQRFDTEDQIDSETGLTTRSVLLGRPERLQRYSQMIRKMFGLTPDRMNHLGGTIDKGHIKAEVEVGCVFEEQSELVFRDAIERKPNAHVLELLVVLREHKNGLVEIAYNGPRTALRQYASRSIAELDTSPYLITDRVRHDSVDSASIELLSIALRDLRQLFKNLPEDESIPSLD